MLPSEKLTFTIREAMAATGLGRTKFYRLFETGQVPARKAGKRVLILRADLEGYLASLPEATIGRQDAA